MKKIAAVTASAFTIILSVFFFSPSQKSIAEETIETSVAQTPASGLAQLASEALEQNIEESNLALVDRLKDFASKFLGRRYVWGSTGPKSFDCSGFIELPRTSRMQYRVGEKVNRNELKAGDLMFFSSPRSGKGRVGHVAMVVDVNEADGTCTFIHSSSGKGVNLQKFPDGGYYSRNFIGAKRVIPQQPVA